MPDSLRARLLLWHSLTVATVVIVFAASVGLALWRTRLSLVDATLTRHATLLAAAVEPTPEGRVDLSLGPGLRTTDTPDLAHVIWASDGFIIDQSHASLPAVRPTGPGTMTREGRRETVVAAASGVLVQVSADLSGVRTDVTAVAAVLTAIGSAVLAASLFAGWWLVGRALDPLDRINRTAALMTDGDLSARIAVESASDIGGLARALNGAFDRLQDAVDRQRRFTADASHELRTPLTALSTEVQWALKKPRSVEELQASLDVCRRALDRMQTVTENLLKLARAESVENPATLADLSEIVKRAASRLAGVASEAGVSVHTRTAAVRVRVDADRTEEAVLNVLTNAIRYNLRGGTVDVAVEPSEPWAVLTVTDTGIGISQDDLPYVFDPFFRGDPARSRDTGGAGLGLAVARAIVEQSGGNIHAESEPGRGTRIVARWPVSEVMEPGSDRATPELAGAHRDQPPARQDRVAQPRQA